MENELFIKSPTDSAWTDAHKIFGVQMDNKDFIGNLCAPAGLKEFVENSSRLENGKRVTVKNPKLAARDLTLTFVIFGASSADFSAKKAKFVTMLQKGEIWLKVPALGAEVYRLIYTKSTSYAMNRDRTLCKVACKFTEPNPANRADDTETETSGT